jgi:hypothetical protein
MAWYTMIFTKLELLPQDGSHQARAAARRSLLLYLARGMIESFILEVDSFRFK